MKQRDRKKMAVITLGCQMNRHDSERIAGALEYDVTEKREDADFLLINTCTVRDKAEQKFFSLLGRLRPLKANNRNLVIGVAGCVAQDRGEDIIRREPMVDLVIGTRAMDRTPEMLERFYETGEPQVDTSDSSTHDEYPMKRESEISAWVSIMQGCDNRCSYCIVPDTRGRETSRPAESILGEIRALARDGYKEVTLLGQNVNSYGAGLWPRMDFARLLRQVSGVDGLERIRFVTSHPKDLTDDLINAMGELPNVAPALHLPMQSGSDRVLDMMRRGYTVDHYFDRMEKLRAKVADIAITSDIIVGFPGETEEDFEATAAAIHRARFDNIFLFKFSPRRGTPAAELGGRVDPVVLGARFDRIMRIQKKITAEKHEAWVGREVDIIVEGPSKKNQAVYTGRTAHNLLVHFQSHIDYTGKTIRVRIKQAGNYSLRGIHC